MLTPSNALTHPFSSIGIHDRFLVDWGLSQFHPSVSLRGVDPRRVPHLVIARYITNNVTGPPPSFPGLPRQLCSNYGPNASVSRHRWQSSFFGGFNNIL
jgi:hypothetical protein